MSQQQDSYEELKEEEENQFDSMLELVEDEMSSFRKAYVKAKRDLIDSYEEKQQMLQTRINDSLKEAQKYLEILLQFEKESIVKLKVQDAYKIINQQIKQLK